MASATPTPSQSLLTEAKFWLAIVFIAALIAPGVLASKVFASSEYIQGLNVFQAIGTTLPLVITVAAVVWRLGKRGLGAVKWIVALPVLFIVLTWLAASLVPPAPDWPTTKDVLTGHWKFFSRDSHGAGILNPAWDALRRLIGLYVACGATVLISSLISGVVGGLCWRGFWK
ncbi:MAG: hypothetical protein C5B50_12725 [Verrucomicrobia bacterium]|nr:MAG: hypothetical protein C5B50_12725 [Verrucomicrobiota bacterium]